MSYYKGEHNKLSNVCNQVLNLIHIHPHLLNQDSQLFTVFTLAVDVKPVDVDLEDMSLHDTDNSELNASAVSNTTLPWLEAIDAEKVLNKEERKKRKVARKAKREAREKKKKKKEQQSLEDKKQRKEERKLKREARRKRRELGRRKKRRQPMHHKVTYEVVPKMEMMMSPTK